MVSILRINYRVNDTIMSFMTSQPKYIQATTGGDSAEFTFADLTTNEKNTILNNFQAMLINWRQE